MKDKYLVLHVFEASDLQKAYIRSLLHSLVYIEIGNMFVVSCARTFKGTLRRDLNSENINYLLIYVNIKTGGDVIANGLNSSDLNQIKNIIIEN